MSWREYQNNDRLEQEQLEIIRALIEDATKDAALWLQADPSAVERAHVLAIQAGLADLDRIIERRMERRKSPKDKWEYSETVSEVLSRLDKAREVRGNIVGKGLARLADRLPKELHGSKALKLHRVPAPVRPVSTALTSFTLSSREPKPTQIPPNPPTYFPPDLWPKTCVILAEAVKKFPDRKQQMPELCRHVISKMTPLFRDAVEIGAMRADLALSDSGMGGLLHSLLVYNCDKENERFRLDQEARKSDEWLKLAKQIADVAQEHSDKKSRMAVEAPEAPASAQTLEERIEKERAQNDWLAREIARLIGETRFDLMATIRVGAHVQELNRQKSESDERLASLTQRMSVTSKTGVAASNSHPDKKSQKVGSSSDLEVAKRVSHADAADGYSGQREGPASTKRSRLSASINCPSAARRMEAHLQSKGISQTAFATQVGTTDRTLRSFRQTGKVRRDIFDAIAKILNITKEELMKPE